MTRAAVLVLCALLASSVALAEPISPNQPKSPRFRMASVIA